MSTSLSYHATVCGHCRTAALATGADAEARFCATCWTRTLTVPNKSFGQKDIALFNELEQIVSGAQLSCSEATLLAAELDSVSSRWEPPELVLAHVSPRLDGLQRLYDAQQQYSQLLLIVDMLLTVVSARMVGRGTTSHRSTRPSGLRRVTTAETEVDAPLFAKKARN